MYPARPAPFDYHRPESLEQALELLGGDGGGDAKPLAGGQSLLPAMKLRLAAPSALVDLGRVPDLDSISRSPEGLVVGARATHGAIASSDVVRAACPVLAETAAMVGDVQVRNVGTIGGSLAHADPAADYPTVVKALEGTISVAARGGTREIAAEDFFVDVFTTALGPGELITSVRVPETPTGAVYLKHRHPASRFAVVGVAAVVALEGGSCTRARLVVGGVTGAPVTVVAAGEALVGSAPSEDTIGAAAGKVREVISSPLGDTYASGEYRLHLAEVMARRALREAFERVSEG
jgi:aerobic carbon-monoxide dehydrogenase medium subunit